MVASTEPTKSRVDPRVEHSRRLICEAALDELGEVGYGATTIESIARRAGVGKATVYRHWDGKLSLIESALDLLRQDWEVPQGGSARERIVAMLTWLARQLEESTLSRCMPAIVSAAQYDASVRDFHRRFTAQRRRALVDLVTEGVERGELDADLDVELTTDLLVGPLFYRRLVADDPYPADVVPRLVEAVLGPDPR